jgi:pimeloyl-ACP methyl ester carboxylesterase
VPPSRGSERGPAPSTVESPTGQRLEYAWLGPSPAQAPTIVFLHEGLGSLSTWRDFPEALCRRTGCGGLVYSRAGHGRSDPLQAAHSTRFMHDEALVVLPFLLDAFEIHRPILFGHSDGASIALIHAGSGLGNPMALALEAPHVFVEAFNLASIERLCERFATTDLQAKLARHHGDNTEALFRAWTGIWLDPGFRDWNIEQDAARVRCPTLLIQGLEDEYGTTAQVERIAGALGGACETLLLADCGHAPHRKWPAEVEEAVARLVARVTGRGPGARQAPSS